MHKEHMKRIGELWRIGGHAVSRTRRRTCIAVERAVCLRVAEQRDDRPAGRLQAPDGRPLLLQDI